MFDTKTNRVGDAHCTNGIRGADTTLERRPGRGTKSLRAAGLVAAGAAA